MFMALLLMILSGIFKTLPNIYDEAFFTKIVNS